MHQKSLKTENSSPPRSFEKKRLLKVVLVQLLKRKSQMQQKTLNTFFLIKLLLKEKVIKNPIPNKILKKIK